MKEFFNNMDRNTYEFKWGRGLSKDEVLIRLEEY
jgi:hypothetical protein